jgi:stage II sporulation protein D
MRGARVFIAWCVLVPGAVWAQDVRVRIYTARPPAEILIRGLGAELRWKACIDCPEKSGHELKIVYEATSSDEQFYVSGRYELRPASGPPFSANFPLHIERHEGVLLVTMTMPLEEYVGTVMMAESGDFENAEARKAMAVVARTYAARFRGQHAKEGFDFCDTTHCQVFGWKAVNAAVRTAVDATRGQILQFEGKPAATYYHQNCGGKTAAAKEVWPGVTEPYLISHEDRYCKVRGVLRWESSIRVDDLDRALRASGLKTPAGWSAIEIALRSESGRTQRLKLTGGGGGDAAVSASTFRFAVDRALGWEKIRSDLYEVHNVGGQIVFSGRGAGHGVGLCQAGADEMAREGKSYREILSFYYPGTELGAAETTAWQKRGGERVELVSTQPDTDSALLPIAERILKEDEETIGWKTPSRVRLQVYPTLDAYRDTTGQPGWVAASTRAHTIRLQPLKELQQRGIVESTLRHEILHVLVEAHTNAKVVTPLWFREGIVLCLSNPNSADAPPTAMNDEQVEGVLREPRNREDVQKAYAAAQSRVAALMQTYGKETVLAWLSGGIPGEVRGTSGENAVTPHH